MLPCAASIEKEGSIANSGRLMQWRYKAVDAPGEALPDGDIMSEIFFKVKELTDFVNQHIEKNKKVRYLLVKNYCLSYIFLD